MKLIQRRYKYTSFLLLLAIILVSNKSAAQTNSAAESVYPQVFTPQAKTLGSVALTPVNMYTGKPSINIPVYTVDHYGLKIPISLTYDASPFIPSKVPGLVGLNWSLVAGGVITRSVNTIPDDETGDGTNQATITGIKGFLVAQPYNLYSNSTVETVGGGIVNTDSYYQPTYELSPDLFMFNFGGHSGKFMMGLDGQVHVQSDEHLKVDIQLPGIYKIIPLNYSGKITITTDDGYKYEFGGTYSSIEFSYLHHDSDFGTQIINAWYLTKVTSPEGNTTNFIYANKKGSGSPEFLNTDAEFTSAPALTTDAESITKSICLRSIECRNNSNTLTQKVNFVTSAQTLPFSNYKNEQLDNIQVFDQDNVLKTSFDFGYAHIGFQSFFGRNFLTTFCEHGLPNYVFNYGSMSGVADPGNMYVDYWGYYNGRTTNRTATTPANTTYDVNMQMTDPLPSGLQTDLTNAQAGMLKSITYPTGGVATYTYEVQDYKYTYNLYPIAAPGLILTASAPGVGGGLRVSQVTLTDGNGNTTTKQYKYVENYTPTAGSLPSSGIMALRPNFLILSGQTIQDQYKVESEPFVTYDEVAEVTPGNGYTIYKFTSKDYVDEGYEQTTHPYALSSAQRPNGTYTYPVRSDFVIVNFYRKRSSRGLERGKPSLVTNYNQSGVPVSSVTYTYNLNPDRYNDRVTSIFFPNISLQTSDLVTGRTIYSLITSFNTYFFSTKLKREDHRNYNAAGVAEFTSTTWYNYNASNQLFEKIILGSDQSLVVEKSNHVSDYVFSGASTNVIKQMQDNNILDPVIEKQVLKRTSTSTSLLSGSLTNYQKWGSVNNIFRPSNVERIEIPGPIADTTFSSISSGSLVMHPRYNVSNPAMSFLNYDGLGNLLKASSPSTAPPASYIWGYNNQYPTAKVTNASDNDILYESFEEGAGNIADPKTGHYSKTGGYSKTLSGLDNGSYLLSYWQKTAGGAWNLVSTPVAVTTGSYPIGISGQVDDVRFCPAGAQMTTYTYDPLAGMTSSTDPKGEITYYEYDTQQRLMNIKDKDGNIVKHMDYHYAQ
ncbi:MAG: hypothetical protein V4577_28545 [Bacteroidota bacterium]